MKKVSILMSLAIIVIAGAMLNSCEKSTTDPVTPVNDNPTGSNVYSPINIEVIQHALTAYLQDRPEMGNLKSGAQFIPAFFTVDGFGFIKDPVIEWNEDCGCFFITSGKLVFFFTELDEDDFYRLNPDSTVSVHINSKTASATYFDIDAGTVAFGDGCNMSMNFTGPWVIETFEWEGVTYTYQFVDVYNNPNAAVWHGAGKVQYNGTGPKHNLVGHLTANPGWTNVTYMININ